jgi:uncharacterized protein (TIGR02996 family)
MTPQAGPRSEAEAFLRDVMEHPDDDAPRLIFADWLQDQPDPVLSARGELVRVQVQRARMSLSEERQAELQAREEELLRQHAAAWLGPLHESAFGWSTKRGLVRLYAGPGVLAQTDVAGLADEPAWLWVEQVELSDVADDLPDADVLAWFPGLDLSWRHLGLVGARRLTGLGELPRLLHLNLDFTDLGPDGAAELARAPLLARLTTLRLDECHLGTSGVRALASSPHLAALTTLNLRYNGLDDAAAEALATTEALPRLTTLYLGHNRLTARGVERLAAAPGLPRLTTVYVEHNGVSEAGKEDLRLRYPDRLRF